jgi:hypothetical protein
MDEGRKHVIGIMAAILASRKLAQQDSTKPSPASNAIRPTGRRFDRKRF